jgi:hypothetical protein
MIFKHLLLSSSELGTPHIISRSPAAKQDDNSFSRASVCGLFLTISFCLLAQPSGSLLYERPRSPLGRAIFLFWRLNPLACFLEIIILAFASFYGVCFVIKQSPADFTSLTNHMCAMGSAIQMLRIHGRSPEGWSALEDSQGQTNGIDNPSFPGDPGPTYQLDASVQNEPFLAPSFVLHKPQLGDANTSATSPQRPAGVESGGITSTQSKATKPAELALDLFGTAGALIVIIKLASIAVPLYIRLPAATMITSWALVQALYLASKFHNTDKKYIIRHTLHLERKLQDEILWKIFTILLLPLFAYLGYIVLHNAPAPIHIIVPIFTIAYPYLGTYPYIYTRAPRTEERLLGVMFLLGLYQLHALAVSSWMTHETPFWFDFIMPFFIIVSDLFNWATLPNIFIAARSEEEGRSREVECFRCLNLGCNLVATGFFFSGVTILYDPSGTHKLAWLDWLG